MNFSIIDFETATPWRGSVCAVGLTVVRDGQIVKNFYSLINPQEHIHTYHTKNIHHISDADVCDAPTFTQVWPQIIAMVGDYPLGSHNNEFDMEAIQSAVAHWGTQPANFRIFDTLDLFRSAFHCPNGCGLEDIAMHYSLGFSHHNAMEDSNVTAQCVLALAAENNVGNINLLLDTFKIPRPYSILFVMPAPYKHYSDKLQSQNTSRKASVPAKTPDKDIPMTSGHDMESCVVCISGELSYCSRSQARELIILHGGKATTTISGKTTVLLIGEYSGYPAGYISGKHKEALDRIDHGQNIEIWHEEDFLRHVCSCCEDNTND